MVTQTLMKAFLQRPTQMNASLAMTHSMKHLDHTDPKCKKWSKYVTKYAMLTGQQTKSAAYETADGLVSDTIGKRNQ